MNTGSQSDEDEQFEPVLRLMRSENWFWVVGGVAILAVVTAAFVADHSRNPARTFAEAVIGVGLFALVVAGVGVVVMNVREDRAIDRVPFVDVSELMDKHKWEEAIAKLEVAQASADPSTLLQAWNLLAQCYAATGRNAESEAMIRRSIKAAGDSDDGMGEQLGCLGVVVRRQGRTEEAEELMTRALDLLRNRDPEATVFVLRNLAYLYWVKGEQAKARDIYDRLPGYDHAQLKFLTQILEPFVEPGLPKAKS